MVTAKAKARGNGKMIQHGCKLDGSATRVNSPHTGVASIRMARRTAMNATHHGHHRFFNRN
jgi:hypothetical protein